MKKIFSAKWLFLVLLVVYGGSYYWENLYRGIESPDPLTFREPVQTPPAAAEPIAFIKQGYAYNLTPVAEYDIAGLIVSRMDYRTFSIQQSDATFPMDLCLIWGDNVKNGVYKEPGLSFRQDFRFCLYTWSGESKLNTTQVSNNHLLINDPEIEKRLKKLHRGDQVRVTGKLVDVSATAAGELKEHDAPAFTMQTSENRTDSGGGACEIIYVEGLEILKRGHPIANFAHDASYYGLLLLAAYVAIRILVFLLTIYAKPKRQEQLLPAELVVHEDFQNGPKK